MLPTLLAGVAVFWAVFRLLRWGRRESFLPPGPPTVPILGNLFDFPTVYPWLKSAHLMLTEMARQYGDVYSMKIINSTVVVLSSTTAIREIMDKNSAIVSDRPASHFAQEITGGNHMGASRYNDQWRRLRRCAREVLTQSACRNHLNIQQAEATQLMYDMLTRPEDFFDSIRRFSTSAILSVLYGKRAPRITTPEVTAFFDAEHHWEELMQPGAHPPVDLIPIMKYIPERWASWKTEVKITRRLQRKLYFDLLEQVEARMQKGSSNGCFMETVIEKGPGFGLDREAVGYIGGNLIEGGADTTSAFLQTLVLALVNFPDVQARAQEELDSVIGGEHSPQPDDIERLPYIQAVIKETHRWRPVAPTTLPHANIEDFSYQDYIIPKGTIIFINAWGIFHDPEVFPKPDEFNPDRWLQDDMKSDRTYDLVFGTARRVCPGMHIARNSIEIDAMKLIWAFKFSKSKDPATKRDKVYDLNDFVKGILTGPSRFECEIAPRSSHHAEVIRREFLSATQIFEVFEQQLDSADREFVGKLRRDLADELHLL
ncbi:cytochrome P450 [Thelephora ganbajun]|uniref:Cytochrome P450 n=1 Tax=Thelephora ganbajun TaxID=370292 RepID=A0ACB6ZDG9_THEGA|nr:cytochrome P450 [Thelephora ganbajun]